MDYHSNVSKIKKIEFDLLGYKELQDDSVVEVTESQSYENNEPVVNGLFDNRMSGMNKFDTCRTDLMASNKSPGYFGSINLAVPVFNHYHMKTIVNVLSVTCLNCSRLLVDDDNHMISKENKMDDLLLKKKLLAEKSKKNSTDIVCEYCNTKQPLKYSFDKSGINSSVNQIVADHFLSPYLPEFVERVFKRITNETKVKLGFENSSLSNLIIHSVPVCPPFVRPTVFMGNIRSEDHITLKYNELIKNNNTARQLIIDKKNKFLEGHRSILHYDVNTLFDNEANGMVGTKSKSGINQITFAQRITGLTSKEGRIRGNLMSKRVEFSARTVISPDPCISCDEIGIPLHIAMDLTITEKVTPKNYMYLLEHAKNGNTYPGSKGIYKTTGLFVSVLKDNMRLHIGDKVVRHLRNGDYVIINRQPTLHKMSMMGHKVKILPGSSLRLNINVTEPYNADFDGDEMNLHCPQSIMAQNEVKCIAAVSNQCMSPASNEPGIIFVQDNVLSAYRLSSDKQAFTGREMMNVLCQNDNYYVPGDLKKIYSGEDLIKKYIPSLFDVTEYTKGGFHKKNIIKLIKSVWHQSGNQKCFQMINQMQILFREYMMSHAFSLSPRDLNCKEHIFTLLEENIAKCKESINQEHLNIHKGSKKYNSKVLSTKEVFENLIFEKYDSLTKKIKNELMHNEDSRLMEFINSKSKGKEKNILQIKAFLGQQLVNGTRVTTGFTDRTLPHFKKFSEDIDSKGFVSSSFNKGLTATEYFFHTAGGRDGLIDQALQTGQSGYLQYQMVKTLEDLVVSHDGIVKDSNGFIVQFLYGSDGCSSEHLEKQDLSYIASLSYFELRILYSLNDNSDVWKQYLSETIKLNEEHKHSFEQYFDDIIVMRTFMIENLIPINKLDEVMHPVNIRDKVKKVIGHFNLSKSVTTDLDPFTILQSYDILLQKLSLITQKDSLILFKLLLYTLASPKELICNFRFNQESFNFFIRDLEKTFKFSRVESGEPVGMTAALSIGEPSTQLVLNSFHAAGSGSSGGLPRILELMNKLMKLETASTNIHFLSPHNLQKKPAEDILQNEIICKTVKEFIKGSQLFASKSAFNSSNIQSINKYKQFLIELKEDITDFNWILTLELTEKRMLENIWRKMDSIYETSFIYIDDENQTLVMMISFPKSINELSIDKQFKDLMNRIENSQISGVDKITNVNLKKCKEFYYDYEQGTTQSREVWYGIGTGTNLQDLFQNPAINTQFTTSDNIHETLEVLGIEAARSLLRDELYKVLEGVADLDIRHVELLADRFCQKGTYSSVKIDSMERLKTEPLARASYMNVVNEFQKAALFKETDNITGISSNIMVGQAPPCGTGRVNVCLDEESLSKYRKPDFSKPAENMPQFDLPDIKHHKRVKFDFDEFV